jgi:hypothetical protein
VHAKLFGSFNKRFNLTHAIKETVFSMDVKVRKHELAAIIAWVSYPWEIMKADAKSVKNSSEKERPFT